MKPTITKNYHLPTWARCPKTGDDVTGLSEADWAKRTCLITKYLNHPNADRAFETAMAAMMEFSKKNDPDNLENTGTPEGAQKFMQRQQVFDDAFMVVINEK